MPQSNDLSRSLAALDQDNARIAVVEMSQSSWLVAGMIPGVARHLAKKLEASEVLLLSLLHRWREEAIKAGRTVARITVAVEAGRDGFWPAPHGSSPWAEGSRLRARGIEYKGVARSCARNGELPSDPAMRLDMQMPHTSPPPAQAGGGLSLESMSSMMVFGPRRQRTLSIH